MSRWVSLERTTSMWMFGLPAEIDNGDQGVVRIADLIGLVSVATPARDFKGQLVEALEGVFEVIRCIMEGRLCGEGPPCAMHEAREEGQETILDYLEPPPAFKAPRSAYRAQEFPTLMATPRKS